MWPDFVFARLVMSTGLGTQGPFDDYPETWGHGVKYNPNLFSVQELNDYYKYTFKPSTGDHEIELLISEPSNISTFLDAVLSIGMYPVWRQNMLSWRVCQNPNQALYPAIVDHITDRDIISIDGHSLYSPSQSVQYSQSALTYYDAGLGQDKTRIFSGISISVLPAEAEINRDMRSIYRITNAKVMADKDLSRLRRWDAEPFEELNITVTERHASLSAGDIVEISSQYIYGLRESASNTYDNRRAMILSLRWTPNESKVYLTLAILS